MEKVKNSIIRGSGLDGKVGFVFVGCVAYGSPFDPPSSPKHQTRFFYYLGIPGNGGFNPYILPSGVATHLRLIEVPTGLTAD